MSQAVLRATRWSIHVPLTLMGGLACASLAAAAPGDETLYISEGNNLLRLHLGSSGEVTGRPEVFIRRAPTDSEAEEGQARTDPPRRDINGQVCFLPDATGRFVAGEDTGQPDPPPGWGVFTRTGLQIGKLTATYQVEQGEPHGCAIDQAGRLFTSSVGNVGFGSPQGQLIVWFPPFDVYSSANAGGSRRRAGSAEARARAKASDNFCKLATDIGTAGSVAIDGEGRVYVSSSGRGAIYRFSPPFPTGANADGGCGAIGPLGSPMASQVQREVFFDGLYTFSGLAFAANGHLYAASVFTGEILEIAPDGTLIRKLLEPDGLLPPFETGNPMSLAIDSRGSLYYADLDLTWDFPSIGPGPDGKVRRIRFDAAGDPLAPEILADGLGFPDGVSIAPSLTTSGR